MVTCYSTPGKRKSQMVLEAFAAGCGGRMASTEALVLAPGDAAFYGVRPGWARLWRQAKAEGRDWYYLDNAWFDASRETYFRVARNVVQQTEFPDPGEGACRRHIAPWRDRGEHVVLACQSAEFMRVVCGWTRDWGTWAAHELRRFTTRPLVIRSKGARRTLAEDLRGAWALVTHMSCAAVEALVAGIPVFCTGPAATVALGSADLSLIEHPVMPEGRERFVRQLEAAQWTIQEMARGLAWASLNREVACV